MRNSLTAWQYLPTLTPQLDWQILALRFACRHFRSQGSNYFVKDAKHANKSFYVLAVWHPAWINTQSILRMTPLPFYPQPHCCSVRQDGNVFVWDVTGQSASPLHQFQAGVTSSIRSNWRIWCCCFANSYDVSAWCWPTHLGCLDLCI